MRQFGRMLGIYGLLGVIAGLFAVAFDTLITWADAWLLNPILSNSPDLLTAPGSDRWALALVPALGGLASGIICARLAPEAMGSGTNRVIDDYLQHRGEMRRRVPVVKALASALTLGSGGSAGIEGPVGQISAGIGAWFGWIFKLSPGERRVLLMAGFAAGIGAVFHAPMAAAIFAAEVLYAQMDIEHEVLVPAIIASTIAHAVFGAIRGWGHALSIPTVSAEGLEHLPGYFILAAVLAGAAILFVRLFRLIKRRLGRASSLPLWLRPAVGGLGVGLVGLFVPYALGRSGAIVRMALDGTAIWALLLFAAAKMLTSALTTGSGGAGGLFAPALVIGAALGGAVGGLLTTFVPSMAAQPEAYVVVGMAGFFAAVANAPISTVIMVSELVGSYQLIVPALWVCTLAWAFTRHTSIFSEQVATRMDAPFRLSDMMGAVLHRITVKDAMSDVEVRSVAPEMHLRELVAHFAHSVQSVFPIVRDGVLSGVVDGRQLRRALTESGVEAMLIANDFQAAAVTVTTDTTLFDVIGLMTATGFDDLVIVDQQDDTALVGLISRREVINAYHQRMLARSPSANTAPKHADAYSDTDDRSDADDRSDTGDTLIEALRRGVVLTTVIGDTPQAIISALLACAPLPESCDRAQLLAQLQAREALGSTAVGNGVAIPHPHAHELAGIDEARVVLAMLDKPVDWDAFDGEPVSTVCMLLSPCGDQHLALLGALARALHDEPLRLLLRQRAPEAQIIERVAQLDG